MFWVLYILIILGIIWAIWSYFKIRVFDCQHFICLWLVNSRSVWMRPYQAWCLSTPTATYGTKYDLIKLSKFCIRFIKILYNLCDPSKFIRTIFFTILNFNAHTHYSAAAHCLMLMAILYSVLTGALAEEQSYTTFKASVL